MAHGVRLGCITIVLLLWSVSAVFAASVSIIPSGVATYVIQGAAMDGVAGIDLTLGYDSSTLSNPSVKPGGLISGALLAANTSKSGTIKIGIISTNAFSGSGPIAVVTFAFQKGAGGLSLVSANLIDSNGATMSAGTGGSDSVFSSTPGVPFSQSTAASTTASTSSTTPASATTAYQGSVTMPADTQAQTVPKPADASAIPIRSPTEVSTVTSPASPQPPGPQPSVKPEESTTSGEIRRGYTYTPVLERFRTYQGKRSPAFLVALFNDEVAPSINQDPAVVLCDGSTHVRITVSLPSPDGHSPNFVLDGVRLISLTKGDQPGSWTIEVLPQANALKASLTILNGSEVIEFPLTVAPPLKAVAFSEADFAAFLKNSGKTADLNNDGVRDYIDDYIYTANYLAHNKVTPTATHSAGAATP